MIRVCKFNTLQEMSESEHYDHLYQKALSFSTVTGVDLKTIRDNNLHIQDENDVFPLDQYLLDNSIEPQLPSDYANAKKYWAETTNWSTKYKYGNFFVYFKDHSDRSYDIIEVEISDLIPIDNQGNEIVRENVTVEEDWTQLQTQ